jgi:hypothetical protein
MSSDSIPRFGPSQPAFQNEEEKAPPLLETYFSTRLLSAMTLLPVSQQLAIVTSLLWHLDLTTRAPSNSSSVSLDGTDTARGIIKRESLVLWQAIGDIMKSPGASVKPKKDKEAEFGAQLLIWPLVSAVLDKGFTEGLARVIVCWAAQSRRSESGKFYKIKLSSSDTPCDKQPWILSLIGRLSYGPIKTTYDTPPYKGTAVRLHLVH